DDRLVVPARLQRRRLAQVIHDAVAAGEVDDRRGDALRERVEVVATLLHGDDAPVTVGVGDVDDFQGQVGVVGCAEPLLGQGIVPVGVEPGGEQYDVGLEAVRDGPKDLAEDGVVDAPAGARGQWNIYRRAESRALAALHRGAGSRIPGKLMRGEVEN